MDAHARRRQCNLQDPDLSQLFDEAFFPPVNVERATKEFWREGYDGVWEDGMQSDRLLWLHAPDMMRRECAAYDRMQYLQGTLLPHAYGFHEVSETVLHPYRVLNDALVHSTRRQERL